MHSPFIGAGRRRSVSLLALTLLFVLPDSARAVIRNVPGTYPTIQAGINAAAMFGDEVVIANGTYTGAGNRDLLVNKHVVVRSASGDPALCIIDCQTLGRGFLISAVTNVARIEGLTIKNALTDEGGG
ncbi:MAG TPA: hypothetical protein VFP10_04825, partial [Candidatus Eisenbacteria bacterium]|nr:hypothetical protein [Candidatus Eisenbacteria bacterium]